jgi:hypothetical protein
MVDITEISAIVAAAGVLVGVVYYIMEIRHQTKIRQTDLVIRLSSFVDNKEIAEALMTLVSSDFKDVDELREKVSPPTLIIIANFYHRVGVLVQKGLVDADLVDSILYTKGVWENIEPWIIYVRQKLGKPNFFGSFEDLYDEMRKREQKLQQEGVKSG